MKDFLNFIKDYPSFVGIVAIFFSTIGIFIGNWLAIGRDKRKEFNETADILAEIITKERGNLYPISNVIDFYAFRRILGKRELIRFDKCVEKYEKTKNDAVIDYSKADGPFCGGSPYYHDPIPIIATIDKLLKFTKRK